MVNFGNLQLDDETRDIINQTGPGNRPPLTFHCIHGSNVVLMKNGRMAKRRESFCKGLAFSSRPIDIDENVCLRLCEVGTNWSGVLRFGVTNEDPEQYRDTPVPTFACPDLTTKDGYWAKALPERYSSEGNILHFYVNSQGELFYGINGSQKGMFLTGINVRAPMWLILDIYGNSVGVEIIDASEFRPRRSAPPVPQICPIRPARPPSLHNARITTVNPPPLESTSSASRTNDSEETGPGEPGVLSDNKQVIRTEEGGNDGKEGGRVRQSRTAVSGGCLGGPTEGQLAMMMIARARRCGFGAVLAAKKMSDNRLDMTSYSALFFTTFISLSIHFLYPTRIHEKKSLELGCQVSDNFEMFGKSKTDLD
ncbi:Protein CBG15927 [Caenorhabditis briggsae]|uniref:Protein CBG15927 n=1 Tax=Caenorhabditis briggsae TaxID=6238 RepID=A8XNG5_CAEBR|nr:Protein CBG15927 [Caenorhabditis briggsae]CAP34396.1 Protein CBG15927 [Caenorhabditis briggsae]